MCLLRMMLKASGKRGVPQGGVISPLLSNVYLNEVDRMLERAKEVTRYGRWDAVEYARFADDLVVLVDFHPRHQWLRGAVAKRLRQEFDKLGVEVNEEKTRVVDMMKGESFDFLGFQIRLGRTRAGQPIRSHRRSENRQCSRSRAASPPYRLEGRACKAVLDSAESALLGIRHNIPTTISCAWLRCRPSGAILANCGGNRFIGYVTTGLAGCPSGKTCIAIDPSDGDHAADSATSCGSAPTYPMNRAYDPDNSLLDSSCFTVQGRIGTMQSKCSLIPATCGYLFCIPS